MKNIIKNIGICFLSGIVVAFALHVFANPNNFAPGGVNGFASIVGYLTGINMGWFVILFNLPILILVFFIIDKKTSIYIMVYMAVQAVGLIVLEELAFPQYVTENNLIFACIAAGIISGFGYSIMMRCFGAAGGTYAISALITKFKPDKNTAFVSFILDSSVVLVSFFVYGMKIEPVISTLINLFLANYVIDYFLQGMKLGYKVEIITDYPDELARELIDATKHGVTELTVKGMYTNEERYELICIVRRRQLGCVMKIIKKYPHSFANISKVNQVIGRFKK